ncbi:hypothetical protein IAG25_40195 [Caballeronia sp. EK]|nr:hypothetical protein [Caballeronia sp. EK]
MGSYIHDGPAVELHRTGLQHPSDLGKRLLTELVRLNQAPEFEQRRCIRHSFTTQIMPRNASFATASYVEKHNAV